MHGLSLACEETCMISISTEVGGLALESTGHMGSGAVMYFGEGLRVKPLC
jgi:hypothetical protein